LVTRLVTRALVLPKRGHYALVPVQGNEVLPEAKAVGASSNTLILNEAGLIHSPCREVAS